MLNHTKNVGIRKHSGSDRGGLCCGSFSERKALTDKLGVRDQNAETLTCNRWRNISIGPSNRDVTAEAHRAAEESTHGFVTNDSGAGSGAEAASDS